MSLVARFGAGIVAFMALGGHAAEKEEVSKAAAACENCGVIRSIREIRTERPVPRAGTATDPRTSLAYQTGPGAPLLVGPVVVGTWNASGQTSSYVGAYGSDKMLEALQQSSWEVIVRLNDGQFTRVEEGDASDLSVGDRVKIVDGRIQLLNQ
ncbi:MAG: hypothetical protein K2X67_02875 [Burkholderiales bacterium]|nr:hypothetical protein [Burkholderiales bacterium]